MIQVFTLVFIIVWSGSIAAHDLRQFGEFTDPVPFKIDIEVEGRNVPLTFNISQSLEQVAPETSRIKIFANLDRVYKAALPEINKIHKKERCGQVISARNAKLTFLKENMLQLAGRVSFEQWECIKVRVPRFYKWKIREMEKRILSRTKLISQSGDIIAQLKVAIRNKGTRLRVTVEDLNLQLTNHSFLGRMSKIIPLERRIEKLIGKRLNKLEDKASQELPECLARRGVSVVHFRFVKLRNNKIGAELIADIKAPITLVLSAIQDKLKDC